MIVFHLQVSVRAEQNLGHTALFLSLGGQNVFCDLTFASITICSNLLLPQALPVSLFTNYQMICNLQAWWVRY